MARIDSPESLTNPFDLTRSQINRFLDRGGAITTGGVIVLHGLHEDVLPEDLRQRFQEVPVFTLPPREARQSLGRLIDPSKVVNGIRGVVLAQSGLGQRLTERVSYRRGFSNVPVLSVPTASGDYVPVRDLVTAFMSLHNRNMGNRQRKDISSTTDFVTGIMTEHIPQF
jgi:hypothetical protein